MDLLSAVALSTIPGVSRSRAAAIFKDLREHSRAGTIGLGEVIAASVSDRDVAIEELAAAARAHAAALLAASATAAVSPIPWDDERYPPLLRAIVDAPPVLWARGSVAALSRPAVAIVGSRGATPYALEVAARLAGELAGRGMVIVSGLARGADGAAHRGCLAAGGSTIAVLGCGPDVVYPAEHRQLAVSICENGTLVSELGPGAPPLPEHFPLRNRLISGISLATVVVEASERSGSLITARYALEQGRDVMAVPGSVLSGRNRGSHALLKDGAKVVETADDILDELGWPVLSVVEGPVPSSVEGPVPSRVEGPVPSRVRNSLKIDPLVARMAVGEPYELDELVALTGLSGPKLLVRLTEWELHGQIARSAGGRFQRLG